MVPFDVVAGRDDVVCNSGGVTILYKSFEMVSFPIMQSLLGFTDAERIIVPTTSFVYYFRPLRTAKRSLYETTTTTIFYLPHI